MLVLINGTFWAQPNVGSGQYLHGLMRWLPQVAPQHRYLLLLPNDGRPCPPLPTGVEAQTIATPFDRVNANLAKLYFEQIALPGAAKRLRRPGEAAVLFVPYFAPPLRSAVPLVTTVGDIIPLLLPEYRGSAQVQAYMRLVRRAAHQSAHVLTFSAASRADIVAHLGIPAERITPILLAAGDQYTLGDTAAARAEVAARYGLSEPFIYYVGGLDARKNVVVLLHALRRMLNAGQPATLAVAGRALGHSSALFPDLDALAAELALGPALRRIEVPLEDGPLLYRASSVFAFPSRYEGFGLPPLEAMACGAPVVSSDASSLPEVVGNAALLVSPDDIAGWASALTQALTSDTLRSDLRARGLAQAAQFSYQRVAKETIEALEQYGSRL